MRRAVKFTFDISVEPSDTPTLVWVPCPIEDEWQRVISEMLPRDRSGDRGLDEQTGTRMMRFTLPAAGEQQRLEVAFAIERRERRHTAEGPTRYSRPANADARVATFLRPDSRVRTDGPSLERARAIASPDEPPLVIARKIYDHLLATLDYDSRGCTPERSHELGDLEMACDLRAGTCTEFHGLFVAYARALGVPARFTFGYNVPRAKTEGSIAGYHCWADIAHPDGSWFPLDVSEAWKRRDLVDYYFGALDENRIAFTYGRDLQLVPRQAGPPVDRFIMPYAESGGAEVHPMLAFRFAEL